MNSPIRLLASLIATFLAFVAPLRATTYTYTGSANTTINGVTESVFTQTYTLSGTIIAPAQIKIVSTYNGGSTQVETYVFTTTGYKVTHNLLDPSTGAVVSSAQGTWTLQYGSQKNVIQAVAIQLKFKGSPAATATLDIGQEPVPANGGPVTVNGTPFTTSFTVKSGGATTVTTFSGRQISAVSIPPSITTQPVAAGATVNETVHFTVVVTNPSGKIISHQVALTIK